MTDDDRLSIDEFVQSLANAGERHCRSDMIFRRDAGEAGVVVTAVEVQFRFDGGRKNENELT